MFENIVNFFKKLKKNDKGIDSKSKETAKERLHLVLMQDRANVSADFLDMMRQEIIEVIKKYIDVDESDIDVRLTNKTNEDGTTGAPALYANIPIAGIREEMKKEKNIEKETEEKKQENVKKEDNTIEKTSDESNEKVVKDDSKDEELDESTVNTSDDDESIDDGSEKSDVENEDNKSENDDSEDDNEELDETDDSKDSEEVKEKVSANKSNEE